MRCEKYFTIIPRRATGFAGPPSPVAPPLRARAHETRGLLVISDSGSLTQWEFSCWSF